MEPEELVSKVKLINIEDEMKSSYIDYAMSVIVSRALPDVPRHTSDRWGGDRILADFGWFGPVLGAAFRS